ncbi:hypothetical protein GCM10029976_092270 [Kribbella albertanoniae]|uniref:DOD-type homing endonuclease domain-containing protein n=1 Tax=Kribbella albertanoniae TaxID=1266829 RepID=A0A4R4Q583_9ACTN|nr:LAGLIDADG family homing endonuclease [Kribbella albertanoniae]TDC30321.1 hypothetical protein E1261_13550 [Kribbella albertanoniae]
MAVERIARRLVLTTRGGHKRETNDDETVFASLGDRPGEVVASSLRVGDFLGIRYAGYNWPTQPASLPELPYRKRYGSEKAVVLPAAMTAELAFLLGAYASEGHTNRANWSVTVTNSVPHVLKRVQAAWSSCFDLTSRLTQRADRCADVVASSKRLVEFLELLGCGSRASNKTIPEVVMTSTREHVLAYLQGLALDGYTSNTGAGKWAICLESRRAINSLQELLTRLGIVNAQIDKLNRKVGKTYPELYAAGPWGQELCRLVPFLEPDKAARASKFVERVYTGMSAADVIPGISGRELYQLIPRGRSGRNGRGTGRQQFAYLMDARTRHVSRASVVRLREVNGVELPEWLESVLDESVHFAPLISIETRDY